MQQRKLFRSEIRRRIIKLIRRRLKSRRLSRETE